MACCSASRLAVSMARMMAALQAPRDYFLDGSHITARLQALLSRLHHDCYSSHDEFELSAWWKCSGAQRTDAGQAAVCTSLSPLRFHAYRQNLLFAVAHS